MKFFKLKTLNNKGDTIVEVLIVLAVLSLAFATSTSIATRSLSQSRIAEEHSQALGMLNSQLELLRPVAKDGGNVFQNNKPFCMDATGTPTYFTAGYTIPANQNDDDFSKYAAVCTNVNAFYNQSIVYDSTTENFTLRVRWEGIGSQGRQQETTNYRTYKLTPSAQIGLALDYQCNDTVDNDIDGKIDQTDPGCHSDGNAANPASYIPTDNDETDTPPPPPECSDLADNDGDGKKDFPADPGCSSPADNDEIDPPQCSDGRDNDTDLKTDFPADPGCSSPADNLEIDSPECSNGLDDEGDGRIDAEDPGCHSDGLAFNPASYTPDDDIEADFTDGFDSPRQCSDGVDNDADGKIDYPADTRCYGPNDNDEAV